MLYTQLISFGSDEYASAVAKNIRGRSKTWKQSSKVTFSHLPKKKLGKASKYRKKR